MRVSYPVYAEIKGVNHVSMFTTHTYFRFFFLFAECVFGLKISMFYSVLIEQEVVSMCNFKINREANFKYNSAIYSSISFLPPNPFILVRLRD